MQRHSNLHLEFSALQANRILEYLVRDFGSRLVFGSGGRRSPPVRALLVDWAQIPVSSKRKIASENLSVCSAWIRPSTARRPRQVRPFRCC